MAELKKQIGLYGLTMVAIGSCIGSGIFLTPSQIAEQLPTPLLILLVWGIGGLITVTGALTFSELGAMFPEAGGVYAYLKEGFGGLFGFLYGWAYLLVICSGAIAALSIAFANYLDFIVPLGPFGIKAVAILSIVLLTLINIFRVKAGEIFSNIFTGLKLLGIAAVIGIGFILGSAKTVHFDLVSTPLSGGLWKGFGLALVGVLWSYGGWQHATFLAGETKNARRNVPKAMIIGALVVTLVYLLTNLSYLFLMPVDQIAGSERVAADAVQSVLPFGGLFIAVIIAISVIGTAGIYILSSPRIYYAMARDGLFFKSLAKVHDRFHTPVNAIIAQSVWAILLLLFWGTFEDLITYVVFTDWIFFCLTACAIFIFRRTRKDKPRPYRTLGYPVTPLIFIVITFLFVVNTLIEKPVHAWAGLIFMAAGTVVFYFFKKRLRKTEAK
ncbi:MAG: amino acid permease [Candidatus Aminicenantes bacterium]|nr:amino acid permease [Candidatus Aminicenantes bacterium]